MTSIQTDEKLQQLADLRERAANEHSTLVACLHSVVAVVSRLAQSVTDDALDAVVLELKKSVRAIAETDHQAVEFSAQLATAEQHLKKITERAEWLRDKTPQNQHTEIVTP